jgi:alpha-L-rhamnosidase
VDEDVVWDSGVQPEALSRSVRYAGAPLKSSARYVWSVQLLDGTGQASTAESAAFSTGLHGPSDWGGAASIGGCDNVGNIMRRQFTLPALPHAVSHATAHVAAPGTFKLLVNGKPASANALGAYTQFNERVLYDSLDVTPLLVPGCNALGVILGTGWYGINGSQQWGANRHAIVHLSVALKNGTTLAIVSDASWAATQGPLLSDDEYAGEVFDARREQPGWSECQFSNASAWAPVCVAPWPAAVALSPNLIPQKRMESFAPKSQHTVASGVTVYDFAQNMAGVVEVQLAGTLGRAGVVVKVRHAELLFPNGSLWHHYPSQAEELHYIIRGAENTETFAPLFTYMGFR